MIQLTPATSVADSPGEAVDAERGSLPLADGAAHDSATCLLSGLLGNRILSARLHATLSSILGLEVPTVWLNLTSFAEHAAPAWVRESAELESEWIWRSALAKVRPVPTSLVLVNGYGLCYAAWHRFRHADWIVALDTTPALTARFKRLSSPARRGLLRTAFSVVQSSRFSRFARRVTAWLPISNLCRASLIEDYGVPAERTFVTRSPQPQLQDVGLARRVLLPPYRLLFVGNDFSRKGGELVLAATAQLGPTIASTTIVSNGASLRSLRLPPNVSLVQGLTDPDAIRPYYATSDLLVLPTRYDTYSNVICESFAQGTPVLASGVGGPAELIAESGGGWALSPNPTTEILADAIAAAFRDPDEHRRRADNALRFAHAKLAPDTLRELLLRCLVLPNPRSGRVAGTSNGRATHARGRPTPPTRIS